MPYQSQTTTGLDKFSFSLVPVNLLKLKSSLQDIASQLHEVLGGRSTNSNRDACRAEGVGCPLGEATCTESPCQPFGMSSACWWRSVSKCQAAPVHWLHTASWECRCRAILQCFPKDQNVYLQSRMSQDRLLGLALMHVHHGLHVGTKEICQKLRWHISANEKPKEKLVQHYKTHAHHFEKHKSIFRLHVQHFKRQVQHFPKCCMCRVQMLLCFLKCCECCHRRHARTAFRKHPVTPAPMA